MVVGYVAVLVVHLWLPFRVVVVCLRYQPVQEVIGRYAVNTNAAPEVRLLLADGRALNHLTLEVAYYALVVHRNRRTNNPA
jgi:hypothetical protein